MIPPLSVLLLPSVTYRRTENAASDKTGGQNDALVAILFSAATLEAFIAELALHAEGVAVLAGAPPYIRDLANVINEAEDSRGSVRLKYLLVKSILPGDSYDKGSNPFQDFDLLFLLRDNITHMKPERITEDCHKVIKRLAGLNLCADEEPNIKSSWVHQVTTRAVARWACNVVAEMIKSIRDCFPAEEGSPAWSQFLAFTTNFYEPID